MTMDDKLQRLNNKLAKEREAEQNKADWRR